MKFLPRAKRWLINLLRFKQPALIAVKQQGKPAKGYSNIAWSYRAQGKLTAATRLMFYLMY